MPLNVLQSMVNNEGSLKRYVIAVRLTCDIWGPEGRALIGQRVGSLVYGTVKEGPDNVVLFDFSEADDGVFVAAEDAIIVGGPYFGRPVKAWKVYFSQRGFDD